MHNNSQILSCKKIFAAILLLGAGVFLYIYSDNTLNGLYYDVGFLETTSNVQNAEDFKLSELGRLSSSAKIDDASERTLDSTYTSILHYGENSTTQEKLQGKTHHISSPNVGDNNESTTVTSAGISKFSKKSLQNTSNAVEIKYSDVIFNNLTDFLVWSPECKIQNLSPFNEQAMRYFSKEKYVPCNKHKLLTFVNVSDNQATLYVDKTVLPSYTKGELNCCYSYVSRHGSKEKPDEGIAFSGCTPFENSINLTQPTVKVTCKTKKKKIYENVHEAITVKQEYLNSKLQPNAAKVPSILFVGIDSISRLNLIRSMPKTYDVLVDRNDTWFPLYGYNKIGDNTFPNLMAIFTGYNDTEAYNICNPKKIGPLDSCRFIWKDYKKFGYVTAYAEDETSINTFNYRKKGFIKPPVDHYFRPYMAAAESLGTVKRDTLSFCAGPESSGERIMDLAKNFALTYKEYPSFGFFWMNTFSHNDLKSPSRMDEKVSNFLKNIIKSGTLNNSIVIFLSDHGMRFGEIRHTFSGWLEERLPYIFFSFPPWFREKYPQEIENFQINAHRLTTPYDMYITLQHILVLSGFNYTVKPIATCPLCKSLFQEIGLNRSCDTSGITAHWCTCGGYSKISPTEPIVSAAALYLIGEIERKVLSKTEGKKCAKFELDKVLTSYKSDRFSYKNDTYLLIVIQTKPKAIFESTLHFKKDAKNHISFSIESDISRLDRYAEHAKCVSDERLKTLCFCKYDVETVPY